MLHLARHEPLELGKMNPCFRPLSECHLTKSTQEFGNPVLGTKFSFSKNLPRRQQLFNSKKTCEGDEEGAQLKIASDQQNPGWIEATTTFHMRVQGAPSSRCNVICFRVL